jgi:hypothetical protein
MMDDGYGTCMETWQKLLQILINIEAKKTYPDLNWNLIKLNPDVYILKYLMQQIFNMESRFSTKNLTST